MAPQVLHRVCYGSSNPAPWQSNLLSIQPAILHGFCRRKVRDCDYPAITTSYNDTVRGAFVTGLTEGDLWRLDIFEGSEYERRPVKVRLLTHVGDDSGKGNVEGQEMIAETYVWIAGEENLEEGEWDFGFFQREKMARWVDHDKEYTEVDDAVKVQGSDPTGGRGLNGSISSQLNAQSSSELRSAV